jgi:hypothetical protein
MRAREQDKLRDDNIKKVRESFRIQMLAAGKERGNSN